MVASSGRFNTADYVVFTQNAKGFEAFEIRLVNHHVVNKRKRKCSVVERKARTTIKWCAGKFLVLPPTSSSGNML